MKLRRTFKIIAALGGLLGAGFVHAAASNPVPAPHTTIQLVSEHSSLQPGVAQFVGIHFKPDAGWHVYWLNPGDSGLPPRVEWKAQPKQGSFGPLFFPTPDRIPYGPLMNFGYEGEATFLTRWEVSDDLKVGDTAELQAEVKYLICEKECVPGKAKLSLSLPVRAAITDDRDPVMESALQKLPQKEGLTLRISKEGRPATLKIRAEGKIPGGKAFFFFAPNTGFGPTAPQREVRGPQFLELTLAQKEAVDLPLIEGVLRIGDQSFQVREIFDPVTAGRLAAAPVSSKPVEEQSLALMVLFAFLGGIILNLMPCVLPVLSIKVMAFAAQAGQSREKIRNHSLVYSLGILVSFWIFAAILIGLKSGGAALGWGFQMQSPIFIAVLSVLFFLLGLNLLGVFEIGGNWVGWGSRFAAKEGYAGSFFTGVLTTIAATPCSAPFMGTALGFALTQPAWVSVFILTALAFGLAAPYLVVSLIPGFQRVLPRPGAWMNTLKQFLAFPLFATVIWLVTVLSKQAGAEGIEKVLILLLLSYGVIWLNGREAKGSIPRASKVSLMIVLLGLSVVTLLSLKTQTMAGASASPSALPAPWVRFDEEKLGQALLEKKTVFVNLTADWCVTCKANEHLVLSHQDVVTALSSDQVIAMQGDWTNADENITKYMAGFQRNSVPVYIVYPRGGEPEVLPQILTRDGLIEALRR